MFRFKFTVISYSEFATFILDTVCIWSTQSSKLMCIRWQCIRNLVVIFDFENQTDNRVSRFRADWKMHRINQGLLSIQRS
jgi:hypothetical protein